MKRTYLINDQIRLRAPEPEDIDILYEMENNSENWEVSNSNAPLSRFLLKEYIRTSHCNLFEDLQLRFMIVRLADEQIAGTIDLTDYDLMHNRACVGIEIQKKYRIQGIARQALDLVCQYCSGYLHLKQLYAHIPYDNQPSLKLFNAAGFQQCGLLKEWIRTETRYKDVVFVQKIFL